MKSRERECERASGKDEERAAWMEGGASERRLVIGLSVRERELGSGRAARPVCVVQTHNCEVHNMTASRINDM